MNDCPACQSLTKSYLDALAKGDERKARVMKALLDGHQETHRERTAVVWADGHTWEVRQ